MVPLVLALLLAPSARAEEPAVPLGAPAPVGEARAPWSVSGSEDVEIRYWTSDRRLPGYPDRAVFNYVEQVSRTALNFVQTPSSDVSNSAYLQIDQVSLSANRYRLDGVLMEENALTTDGLASPYPCCMYANPEKIRFGRETGSYTLALGDSYVAFGRGPALNLSRNVDIDIDTSVQGVQTVFRPGAWDVTAVIGALNRQQVFQDNPNKSMRGDVRHAVGGVRVERFGVGPTNLGAHGVAWDFVDVDGIGGFSELGTPDAFVGGGTVEAIGVLGLDSYVELDGIYYPEGSIAAGGVRGGYTLYGSSSAYVGKTTWLLEVKRYQDAERLNSVVGGEGYKVSVPPTLEYERVITEDSSAALGSNDITGARLRMDVAAIPVVLVPYVALGVYRDLDSAELHFNDVPETIVHPVVGVEAISDEWVVLANAGYRVDQRDGAEWGSDRQAHGDIDVKFPIAGKWQGDVTVAFERFGWGVNPFQQTDYTEVESAITIQRGSAVSLILYTDYSDNPLVSSIGNLAGLPLLDDRNYGALELQIKPADAWTVKAFYGAYKAGIRCSGGQCRQLPGFEGGRVSVVGSF